MINGYNTSYILDWNSSGGGILLYKREDIPSYVELNLHNENYLINCSYNSQKTMISNTLATLEIFFKIFNRQNVKRF